MHNTNTYISDNVCVVPPLSQKGTGTKCQCQRHSFIKHFLNTNVKDILINNFKTLSKKGNAHCAHIKRSKDHFKIHKLYHLFFTDTVTFKQTNTICKLHAHTNNEYQPHCSSAVHNINTGKC
jgi:hypothetical protein